MIQKVFPRRGPIGPVGPVGPAGPPGTFTVVPVLPPVGVAGDMVIWNNNVYTWNTTYNTWQPISNYYDINTDLLGPVVFTNFADSLLWAHINYSAYFTAAFDIAGGLTITTIGPAAVVNCRLFSGVICRKKVLPNLAGLIDIQFDFDNVAISNPPANKEIQLGGGIAQGAIAASQIYVGIGARASSVFTHGYYSCLYSAGLTTNISPVAFGTTTGDMATNITHFSMRGQYLPILSGAADYVVELNNPTVTYSHNGAAFVALGGALSPTGRFQNSIVGTGGHVLTAGLWCATQITAAGMTGRLISMTLHAGRLI